MTINQAKGLRFGQKVTHLKANIKGTVVGTYQNYVLIQWEDRGYVPHKYTEMHSIHVMAN